MNKTEISIGVQRALDAIKSEYGSIENYWRRGNIEKYQKLAKKYQKLTDKWKKMSEEELREIILNTIDKTLKSIDGKIK